jgi:hypothetical protein
MGTPTLLQTYVQKSNNKSTMLQTCISVQEEPAEGSVHETFLTNKMYHTFSALETHGKYR